jgi:hypothetical protein
MMKIRSEQLKVFSELDVQSFEEWMLVHLLKFFPRHCQAAGESRLREIVRAGIARAAAYEITARRDVCMYIDLMIVFGFDFDKDRRYPWAAKILATEVAAQRIDRLHGAAQKHLQQL